MKIKLSLMVIVIMAVVLTGVAVILLWQASNISMDMSRRDIESLARERAEYWKGRKDGYIRVMSTLANVRNMKELGQRNGATGLTI